MALKRRESPKRVILHKQITKFLNSLDNCYCFKVVMADRQGLPPIVCIYNGSAFFIQNTSKRGYSEQRLDTQQGLVNAGAIVINTYSFNHFLEIWLSEAIGK